MVTAVKCRLCAGAYGHQSAGKLSVAMGTPVGTDAGSVGKRSRVFIDPLTEIPRLERWFADDTHPSSYIIEKYTDELNRSAYRQRFPRLEPKNLQLWFKNHRAKMKRQRDASLAAAAAAVASGGGGGIRDGLGQSELCRHGHVHGHHLSPQTGRPASRAFQKVEHHSDVDPDRAYTSSAGRATPGENGASAAFQTAGRSFAVDERQDRAISSSSGSGNGGGFFDQPHPGSGGGSGGGSALDELVLRLRTGPLGRLPDTSALPPTPASCD